jgi:hypothetical protein
MENLEPIFILRGVRDSSVNEHPRRDVNRLVNRHGQATEK